MVRPLLVLSAALGLALAVPAWSQAPPPVPSPLVPFLAMDSLAADFVLGVPLNPGSDLPLWPGIRFEQDFLPGPWGWELGYAFRAKQYFSFDHRSHSWSGPWTWEQTNSGGLSEADWPFYQTRHVISPGLVFRLRESWLQPKLALGLLVQFYVPGEAQDYYPGFQDQFREYLTRVNAVFGNYLRIGADFRPWPVVGFGADFVYEVPDWGRFLTDLQERPAAYAKANAHWELRVGVRL